MVRIQFSRPTVKSLQARLCQAYQQGHVSRVRRISVLLELVVHHTPVAVVSDRWGISPACIYEWLKAFLVDGVASVAYRQHRGGRPAKLTQTQQKQLCKLIDAGPEAAGFETACWNSILIQTVIPCANCCATWATRSRRPGLCPITWTKRVGKHG